MKDGHSACLLFCRQCGEVRDVTAARLSIAFNLAKLCPSQLFLSLLLRPR